MGPVTVKFRPIDTSLFKSDKTNFLNPLALLTTGWLIVESYKISPPVFDSRLIEFVGKFLTTTIL